MDGHPIASAASLDIVHCELVLMRKIVMRGWNTVSRRPTLNALTESGPMYKRAQSISNWLRLKKASWTRSDAKVVSELYNALKVKGESAKGLSEKFYRELYEEHRAVYRKFVFLSRGITGFPGAYQTSQHPRLCSICENAWTTRKYKLCTICSSKDPVLAKEEKRKQLSRTNKEVCCPGSAGLLLRERRLLDEYGVTNVFQLEKVKEKRKQTLRKKFGDSWQEIINAKREKTNQKRYGAKSPFMVRELREKGYATIRRLYGVEHAMQNHEVFTRAMKVSHRISRGTYKGRPVRYQGTFEFLAFKLLANQYGVCKVHSQFHRKYPSDVFQRCRTFPDFWVEPIDRYVEVKSTWTLHGKKTWWLKNVEKAKRQVKAGVYCNWVVIKPQETPQYQKLPRDWYTMSLSQLRLYTK